MNEGHLMWSEQPDMFMSEGDAPTISPMKEPQYCYLVEGGCKGKWMLSNCARRILLRQTRVLRPVTVQHATSLNEHMPRHVESHARRLKILSRKDVVFSFAG